MVVTLFDPPYPKTPRYMETMYLLEIEVLHCGNRDFRLFCSCDIDLDPMTFMNERDPYSLEVHRMCKYELFNVKASKVIV